MDSVVQLVRNGLCCIKDLQLFPDTFLHDPAHTALYYKFPEPLNKTTPLEVVISIFQFYPFIFVTIAGYRLIVGGIARMKRATRLLQMLSRSSTSSRGSDGGVVASVASKIVRDSLAEEGSAAVRSIWVGVNVLPIGVSFFWLFANSWHVTETDWIGGLQGLIHALTVMEIGLVSLLYYMVKDGTAKLSKSKRMRKFANVVKSCKGDLTAAPNGGKDLLDAETYGWVVKGGWAPFWSGVVSANDVASEEKMIAKEVEKIELTVSALLADEKQKEDDKSIKSVRASALEVAEDDLPDAADKEAFNGYLEYLFFVLNLIAFWGYLLGILVFYYDDDSLKDTYTGTLKLGLSNTDADWHGNFAGDFMWTVEPVFVLGNTTIMNWMKPRRKKVKAD